MWSKSFILQFVLLSASLSSLLRLSNCVFPQPGEDLCVLNRITECLFLGTPEPDPDNEYGIYTTQIIPIIGPGGICPLCIIEPSLSHIKDILTNGDDPRIKYLFSPGFEQEVVEQYGNQAFVTYNVNCPDDHNAYFEIIELELEDENCQVNNENECRDFLQINSEEHGSMEFCGTLTDLEDIPLLTGNLQVLFRSSDSIRFNGFNAVITCIPQDAARKKRSNEYEAASAFKVELARAIDYIERKSAYYRRLGYYYYYKRYFPHLFRLERIPIQFDGGFTYINNKLTITQGDSIVVFDDIRVVKILDSQGKGVTVFRVNAKDSMGKPITINGPGTLHIVGCSAFYKNFIIDPKGILPLTAEERLFVRELGKGHFDNNILELRGESLSLCDPRILEPPNFEERDPRVNETMPDMIPVCPRPVRTAKSTCNWSDMSVLKSLANFNAPNVIVRTIARVAVNCTRVFQPGRIEELLSAPLSVDCVIDKLPGSEYSVRCVDNREGRIWFVSCSVVDIFTGEYTSLNSFCSYPSFRFPLDLLSPGTKKLVLTVKDSSGTKITEVVKFFAKFFVTCDSQVTGGSLYPLVNVRCTSNQSPLLIKTCELNGRPDLFTGCAFPEFKIEPLRLGLSPGSHSLVISFVDSETFEIITLTIDFSF